MELLITTAQTKYGNLLLYKPAKHIKAIVDLYESGDYERELLDAMVAQAGGKCFVDVGAEFGYWSLVASQYFEQVIAYEPHPLKFGFLQFNTMHLNNMICLQQALGEPVKVRADKPQALARIPKKTERIYLPPSDLTGMGFKGCLFKIDIEGAEFMALKSLGDMLYDNAYLVEIHEARLPAGHEAQLVELMKPFKQEKLYQHRQSHGIYYYM